MTTRQTTPPSGQPGPGRDGAMVLTARPLTALTLLAERMEIEADPVKIHVLVEQALAARSARETDEDRVVAAMIAAAQRMGMRLDETSIQAAPAIVRAGRGTTWLVVTEQRGARFLVTPVGNDAVPAEARWVDAGEIAAIVGASASDPIAWLTAAPLAPLARASSHDSAAAGGHGDGHGGHHMTPAQRLLAVLRTERHDLWVAIVYAAGVGVMALAIPATVQALVNTVAFGGLIQPLVVLTLLLLGALALAGVMRAMQALMIELIQQRLFARLSLDLAHRLPRARLDALDREHGPELVNRFFDVFTVQKGVAILLMDGFAVVLQTGIAMLVLAFYHPLLLAFDVALVIGIVVLLLLGRGATETAIDESRAKYDVAAWLEEMVRHPLTFRPRGAASWAAGRVEALTRRYLHHRRRHFRVVFRQTVASIVLQAAASAALLGVGGGLVLARQLTLGQLVAAELIVSAAVAGVLKFGKYLENYYDLLAAVDKLGHLLDLPLEERAGAEAVVEAGPAALCFADVRYAFPGSGAEALRGVSFALAPGDRLVVQGVPGAGKTTLVELCYGLRAPTAGHIELDGRDLRHLDAGALRDQVALVRGIEVFAGTVAENVRVGRAHVTDADVRAALDAVGLRDAIAALPAGLDTALVTDGAPLSEGQARLLCFARALAGRPRLLLVDDGFAFVEDDAAARLARTLFDPAAPFTLIFLGEAGVDLLPAARRAVLTGGALIEGGARARLGSA